MDIEANAYTRELIHYYQHINISPDYPRALLRIYIIMAPSTNDSPLGISTSPFACRVGINGFGRIGMLLYLLR